MDAKIRLTLESIVQQFVDNSKSFTSIDVANYAKDQKRTWVKNSEVASWLRSRMHYFSTSNYAIKMIQVQLQDGSSTSARLYHSRSVDPDAYSSRSLKALSPLDADHTIPIALFTKAATTVTSEILEQLSKLATVNPISIAEINVPGVSRKSISTALSKLYRKGLVERVAFGKYRSL